MAGGRAGHHAYMFMKPESHPADVIIGNRQMAHTHPTSVRGQVQDMWLLQYCCFVVFCSYPSAPPPCHHLLFHSFISVYLKTLFVLHLFSKLPPYQLQHLREFVTG